MYVLALIVPMILAFLTHRSVQMMEGSGSGGLGVAFFFVFPLCVAALTSFLSVIAAVIFSWPAFIAAGIGASPALIPVFFLVVLHSYRW